MLLRCGPCPIAGATAPYPLAGTLVQSWAEVLAQVVENLHKRVEELIANHKPSVPQERLDDALNFLKKEKDKL